MGTAEEYSVLSGVSVTSTGATAMSESLGSVPAASLAGTPIVLGETNVGNAKAATAKLDLDAAFGEAKTRLPSAPLAAALDGVTFKPGVYGTTLGVATAASQTVTLDGEDDPNAVFIFQIGGTMGLGASTEVKLINQAQACNVYWAVSQAIVVGANSKFAGTLMSGAAVTIGADSSIDGRVMSTQAAITLANNAIHTSKCPKTVLTGPPGPAGPAGSDGEDGATGPAGPAGSTGATGPTGAAGTNGEDGEDGEDGAGGAPGERVLTEAVPVGNLNCLTGGVRLVSGTDVTYVCNGSIGASGAQGALGATGAAGADGLTGAVGATGIAGATGAAGLTGIAGLTGAVGATGIAGATGAAGFTGTTGADGRQGVAGADGMSGARGATGTTGAAGATGAKGDAGTDGTNGTQGADGSSGAKGADGSPGATGPAGAPVAALRTALCVSSRPQRAQVRRGRRVTWTVSVTNCGGRVADNVKVALRLGMGFSLKRAPGSSVSGGQLSWTRGSLAPNATASYKMTLELARTIRRGLHSVTVSAEGDNAPKVLGAGTTRVGG
jgi:hypothetical protein